MIEFKRHVLVVDDLADNRGLLVQWLEEDYRVSEAGNGEEALAVIAADRPDLMLLDLTMPVMDGFAVLERLRGDGGPFLPVIVVTAASERESRLEALRLGAQEFLTKPIDAEELLVRVKTLMALKEARDELEDRVERRTREVAWEQEFSERLIWHVPAGVAFLSPDLVYQRANPARTRLGEAAPAFLRRSLREAHPEAADRLEAAARRVLATGLPEALHEVPMASGSDERQAFWDIVYCLLPDEAGRPLGLLEFSQDVSGRVQKERLQHEQIEQLRQLDRYKDEFLSIISHELRTPLNFIMGFTSILDDELSGPLNAEQRANLAKIMDGAERMLGLVNDLLEFAKIRSGKFSLDPVPTAYAPMVAEAVESLRPLAAQKAIALSVEGEVIEESMIDAQRVVQVITNLVGNAIKFTPEGGAIQVRVASREGELHTAVVDTGIGIAEADIPRVFERFRQLDMSSTREAGGTGLGLAICKAIVEAHGGAIGVESTPGEGSTFWFTLPTRVAASAQARVAVG